MDKDKLEEWDDLKQWAEDESKIQSVKILLDLGYSDIDIEIDLGLTRDQLAEIKRGLI